MPALVRALNRVDLPTLGNPTIPHLSDMSTPLLQLTTETRSARRKTKGTNRTDDAKGAKKPETARSSVEIFCDLCGFSRRLRHLFGFVRALRVSVVHSLSLVSFGSL